MHAELGPASVLQAASSRNPHACYLLPSFGRRVSTPPWAAKRGRRSAPRPKTSIDESLQVSGQDWHAFASRNCIAAATHAANTGDHGDHAAEA